MRLNSCRGGYLQNLGLAYAVSILSRLQAAQVSLVDATRDLIPDIYRTRKLRPLIIFAPLSAHAKVTKLLRLPLKTSYTRINAFMKVVPNRSISTCLLSSTGRQVTDSMENPSPRRLNSISKLFLANNFRTRASYRSPQDFFKHTWTCFNM